MRVLHLINTLSAGGAELHLLTLCRYLKRAGVEVVVAYLKQGRGSRFLDPDFEREGIEVVNLGGERLWDGSMWRRAIHLVRQEKPDIVHTHLPRADLMGFVIRKAVLGVQWVSSAHAVYSRSWRGKWALPLWGLIWRHSDRIIAISRAVKEWLVRNYRIPEGKVQVVYYGIEPERFLTPSHDLRSAWGLGKVPVIGTIGRLEPVKGHDVLIRAMPLVLRHLPEATLLIAGHDAWGYGRALQEMVDSLGLNGRVRLVGFQSDIPSFLHAIDVFAFASRSEGFGQVLIEAMAAGKPVVATRIPPITEIVINGETGLLVPPGDPEGFAEALVHILSNPEKANKMAEKGIQRVRNLFSATIMAEKTMEVYKEVLTSASNKG